MLAVVSEDDPGRDYVTKRREYASAGVAEYWIVDRAQRRITVLRLQDGQYVEHGQFGEGQNATSYRFAGFQALVDDVLGL